jgi:4-hydroxybenzoate polyprenyltransferase
MSQSDHAIADAAPSNWVDRYAPASLRPWLRLVRADRPAGVWLLLLPCWWSSALASIGSGARFPDLSHLALFAVGAFVMRGAGCAYNDIVDRDYDAKVARTRDRPVASGAIKVPAAWALLVGLSFVGLAVLLQFNWFTVLLGIASLGVVAAYPFAKRVTFWPQAVLGLAFSWGALMGWAAVFGGVDPPALALYAGAVCWTIGYDTIYAHQDAEDDALIGLKSTALRFGEATRPWLWLFFGLAWLLIVAAGLIAGAGWIFLAGMGLAGAHLAWQVATLDIADSANCLTRFRANRDFGLIVFAALVLDALAR